MFGRCISNRFAACPCKAQRFPEPFAIVPQLLLRSFVLMCFMLTARHLRIVGQSFSQLRVIDKAFSSSLICGKQSPQAISIPSLSASSTRWAFDTVEAVQNRPMSTGWDKLLPYRRECLSRPLSSWMLFQHIKQTDTISASISSIWLP